MKKSAIYPAPQFYDTYISKVPDITLAAALTQSLQDLENLDMAQLEPRGDYAYAPGKWSIKNVLQHITDTERIFNFRSLLYARNDKAIPPGMDQDLYADNSFVDHRSVAEVLGELIAVRHATIAMYKGFPDEVLLRTGISWKYEMSVLAMGFTTVGHQLHHLQILRERYL
ncbi:DinB family protein [Chitinophaga nivalis]|uniref:DinB family protein n=1 Tax=Chitinophaga nivalis TaxID=2991709 RepID=A0ABT3ITE2_9BACT|nr:DinB family protein [Chitinophaga nivalis]MCW3463067.1 DinB family protein [Chitinophaga nivalis]MCW3487243.1 DinB family protein [Chitinophaga nivalis]